MSVYKCKMCGGSLEISEDSVIAVCDYCGTKQTVPSADDDRKMSMYGRANKLRYSCDFDKAAGMYESIITDFPYEAEAYWGLILCKYGIEYVDDPATGKKIPTCHRSSFDSVMEDQNFEKVMEYADTIAVSVYREEAKMIEKLRRSILEVSNKEEPYDIFICYKETDDFGDRTIDSVIAQDIYKELTNEGYRVFFSRVSLEDKLGTAYEPYIFAALNSAKVMLAVGTSYDYYNAVWVKNEWSRFLQLISKGEKKVLIPCYKGIDAYDMPKEFRHLQAQDMGKVGAIQDLIRGIGKIVQKQSNISATIPTTTGVTENSLLQRVTLFLESENWKDATDYCEKVLDINPQNAHAYFYRLLAEMRVATPDKLTSLSKPLDDRKNYQLAIRFADESFAANIKGYNQVILDRINAEQQRDRHEQETLQRLLSQADKLILKMSEKTDELARLLGRVTLSPGCRELDPAGMAASHEAFIHRLETTLQTLGVFKSKEKRLLNDRIAYEKQLVSMFSALGQSSSSPYHNLCLDIQQINNEMHDVVRMLNFRKQHMYVRRIYQAMVHYNYPDLLNDTFCNIIVTGKYKSYLSVGYQHTLGLRTDGTVFAVGLNYSNQCEVGSWRDIIAVSAGGFFSLGLKKNGMVEAAGKNSYGQCNVESWRDIISVSAGFNHSVALKKDGTVVAVGDNRFGQCNVTSWKNIVAVSAGFDHTIGLKADGTLIGVGNNDYRQVELEDLKNAEAISAGDARSVVLYPDGTVGYSFTNRLNKLDVSSWKDIVSISTCDSFLVAVNNHGNVFSACDNREFDESFDTLGAKLTDLRDIAYADVGKTFVIGLQRDGTLVSRGINENKADNVNNWKLW